MHFHSCDTRPAGHASHSEAPPREMEPAGHVGHDCVPVAFAKVEGGHGAHQPEATDGACRPGAQPVHDALPGAAILPAAQGAQTPSVPKRPALHAWQPAAPLGLV